MTTSTLIPDAAVDTTTDAFGERNLQKAGYETSPLSDGTLDGLHVHEVALTSMLPRSDFFTMG